MANASVEEAVARLRRSPIAARFRSFIGEQALADPAEAFNRLDRNRAVRGGEPRIPPLRQQVRRLPRRQGRADARGEPRPRAFRGPRKGQPRGLSPSRPGVNGAPPLFTDFTYDNVGLPRNASLPANADRPFSTWGSAALRPQGGRHARAHAGRDRRPRRVPRDARRRIQLTMRISTEQLART